MNENRALAAIKRRWWIIVLFTVVGAVLGALPEPDRVEDIERTFTATHTMLVNGADDPLSGDLSGSPVSVNQLTLFATTGEVPARVADATGFAGNPATLASQVEATFDQVSGALTISSTQIQPARAEELADAFADELVLYLSERQDVLYEERLAASLQRVADAEAELNLVSNELAANPDDPVLQAQQTAISRQYSAAFEQAEALSDAPDTIGLTTLQRAQAVEVTELGLGAPRSRPARALLGGAVGFALGVVAAVVLGRLDRRIRTRAQAEEALDMRARVLVPKVRDSDRDGLVVTTTRHDPLSDSYRTVRNLVAFTQGPVEPEGRAHVTLIVSPSPGDGKTSLAVNLAAAMAESGKTTMLVNGDFRRPRVVSALGSEAQLPLPFMLEDVRQLGVRAMITRAGVQNMRVFDLSAVHGSAVELTRATVDCIPELAGMAEQIVIDSSPLGATAEVLDLVPYADTIVFVARVGHTKIAAARRAVTIIRDLSNAPALLVVGGVRRERSEYYEYGGRPERSAPSSRRRSKRRRRRRRKVVAPAAVGPESTGSEDDAGSDTSDDTPFEGAAARGEAAIPLEGPPAERSAAVLGPLGAVEPAEPVEPVDGRPVDHEVAERDGDAAADDRDDAEDGDESSGDERATYEQVE